MVERSTSATDLACLTETMCTIKLLDVTPRSMLPKCVRKKWAQRDRKARDATKPSDEAEREEYE